MYKNACPACKNACLLICIFWHLFVLLQYAKTYTEHLTKQDNPMTHIALNMIQTAGLGALALIVGMAMTRRVTLLQRFCVPSPVSGGMCGFGLGATPNAMANMSAVCYKYRYSVKPFLIVPIIGAMFADLINTGIITLFLNVI